MWRIFDHKDQRVGIEITSSNVSVVRAESNGRIVRVLGHGSAELPAGVLRSNMVVDSPPLVIALKQALKDAGVETPVRASLALPDAFASMLTVSVPPAPSSELGILVRGELDHYGSVHQENSGVAFFRIEPIHPIGTTEPFSMAAFIAPLQSIQGLVDALDLAGVTAVSAEPQSIGLLRGGRSGAPREPNLYVLVGEYYTDFAYIAEGAVRFYRRVDTGLLAITREDLVTSVGSRGDAAGTVIGRPIRHPETLVTELRRSISFLLRESDLNDDQLTCTLVTSPEYIVDLASALEDGADIRVTIPETPVVSHPDLSEEGMSLAAYGLLITDEAVSKPIPIVSFVTGESVRVVARRRAMIFLPYVVTVALVVLGGGTIAWFVRGRAKAVQVEVDAIQGRTNTILATMQERDSTRADSIIKYRELRKMDVGLGRLMDSIVTVIPPNVGLESIITDATNNVRISGSAKTEDGFGGFMAALQRVPTVKNVQISSFQREGDSGVLKFTLVGIGNHETGAKVAP